MILTPPPAGGQQILRHALARRWTSIVAGTVAGLVVGIATVFAVPVSHSATVSMTVTSPALTPAPAVRASLSNTTDMVTEQGIAKSAAVLDVAAARLGNGVLVGELGGDAAHDAFVVEKAVAGEGVEALPHLLP